MSEQVDELTEAITRRTKVVAKIFTDAFKKAIPGSRGHIESNGSYYCGKCGKAVNVRDRRSKRMDLARHKAKNV